MPERKSSSLKNRLLVFLLLTIPLFSTGCGEKTVWGVPVSELEASLARADYGVLSGIDFKDRDLSEAFVLGPGAPYYLSFVFRRLDKNDLAESMLELAWGRSPPPWKARAGLDLADSYLADKQYERAAGTARDLISLFDGAPGAERARRILVSALYWSKADKETLAEAARIAVGDPELSLIRAVCSLRLNLEPARGLFVDLFLREKSSSVHARAFLFLQDTGGLSMFSEEERNLLSAKYAFQQGDWATGIPLMEGVIAGIEPEGLSGTAIVSELGAAYLAAGTASRGAAFMEKLSRGLSGAPLLDALEAWGKCSRRALDYPKALAAFGGLASKASDPGRQDRARWFILDILMTTNPPDLMDRIAREAGAWNDPSSFSDLLEERISSLLADRKWRDLALLQDALGAHCPDPIRARIDYIFARALQERLIARLATKPETTANDLLRDAQAADPDGYYGVLAACLLGGQPQAIRSAAGATPIVEGGEADPLIQGFISFGLGQEASDEIGGVRQGLKDGRIAAYARGLEEAKDYRRAMNLIAYLGRRRPIPFEQMQILYPRAYGSLIEALAAGSPFPSSVLYGMIREESYFDPDIVSGAGAVGLAQLMPATAADVAKSLRLDSPDLTDPAVSLKLGEHYLEGLLARVGGLTKALLSYNAGLSRSRSWDRLNGNLATDLFVEAVPFEESRQYVRKIVVSTILYAYLYQSEDPWETLRLFFPEAFASAPPARTSAPTY